MSELKQIQQLQAKLAMAYAKREQTQERSEKLHASTAISMEKNQLGIKNEGDNESLGDNFAQTLRHSNTISELAALDSRIKQLCGNNV